jgi:hypothetical protein
MNVLLVEPNFPYPSKSKNRANSIHKNFVPIGLLKLGSYYKNKNDNIKLVRGNLTLDDLNGFRPNKILITSIFTYWSKFVWEVVEHYRTLFPKAEITLGGIYATLHNEKQYFRDKSKKFGVNVHVGLHEAAEKFLPDYSLLEGTCDYYATHAMRGCIRRCDFCGTWRIEPKLTFKTADQVVDEIVKIGKNKVIFFDNNFLANPNVKSILRSIADLKVNEKPVILESQSGYDGRLLEKDPELVKLLKGARFQNIRLAWDNSIDDAPSIKNQIDLFVNAGYNPKDISIFMIYNFDIPYEIMLRKLEFCEKWGVQITDCRFRPLDSTFDNYSPQKKGEQTENDYHIHSKSGWTDKKIKDFRKRVRQHNIWIRYAKDKGLKYSKDMEKWSAIHNLFKFFNLGRPPKMKLMKRSLLFKIRIERLRKLKNYYERHETKNMDFSKLSYDELDKKLKYLNSRLVKQKIKK